MKKGNPHLPYIVLTVLCILLGLSIYLFLDPAILAFWTTPATSNQPISTGITTPTIPVTKYPPVAVRFPKLKKELPVQAALVAGNTWEMFDTHVAWLSTSAVPGEGNVILYAHNRTRLFGDLWKLKLGDIVEVSQNGDWKVYRVIESRAVSPKDVEAILSEGNQLTLYTCEGSFDQKRRVVYAEAL